MRLLAKVTIPMEKEGKPSNSEALPRAMQSVKERLKPEAVYVFEENGKRECLFVFNLDLPSMLKPIFQNLDASFHVTPVMNAEEFEQSLGDARGKQSLVGQSELLADIDPLVPGTAWPKPHRAFSEAGPLPSEPDDELAKKI